MLGVKPSLRFCKKWKYKNPCFFWPLTWIYGLRPPGPKFMGCILKWGGDSEGALNNQKGYKTKLKTNLLEKHMVPYVASNLRLDNAFINDTNVFCPCRLRQEKVSEYIHQYSVQPNTWPWLIQGVFFNWASPEFAKWWPVSNRFQNNVPDWPLLGIENVEVFRISPLSAAILRTFSK